MATLTIKNVPDKLVRRLKTQAARHRRSLANFWRRSLLAGAAARETARLLRIRCEEEAFLAGLLQDIGSLVLMQAFPERYPTLVVGAESDDALTAREREEFGADHTLVGRWLIERYFGAPVINRYGLREFGSWSAQSCELTPERLHINTELVACEILRPDGSAAAPGEVGRVVLTDLWNYVRPFIRYDTGDRVATRYTCTQNHAGTLVWTALNTRDSVLRDLRGALRERRPAVGGSPFNHSYYYNARGQLREVTASTSGTKPAIPDVTYTYHPGGQVLERQFQ